MASHLFLKFLDDTNKLIKGEAQFKDYDDNWIELEGYSWSMTDRSDPQGSIASESPTFAKPELFSLSKFPDSSTNKLLQMHVDGRIGESAEIHIFEELQGNERHTGGVFKLVITLTKVRVTSYKLKVDSNDKAVEMKEDWEFDYESIKFDHKNAGVNVKVHKPLDPDDEKRKSSAADSGGGGASNAAGAAGGGDATGMRDFLSPLGSL